MNCKLKLANFTFFCKIAMQNFYTSKEYFLKLNQRMGPKKNKKNLVHDTKKNSFDQNPVAAILFRKFKRKKFSLLKPLQKKQEETYRFDQLASLILLYSSNKNYSLIIIETELFMDVKLQYQFYKISKRFQSIYKYMDFKNRFQTSSFQQKPSIPTSNNMRANSNFLGRNTSQSEQNQGGALNRFKKKPLASGKAPAGQFKKYMLEANNIFFQNRPQIKKIQQLKFLKWSLILLWVGLSLSYFLINRIQAYKGVCPPQAICGVFVHCPQFFQYNEASNTCVLSNDILLEIRSISQSQVKQLQYAYGDGECSGLTEIPSINLENLFPQVKDTVKRKYYQSSSRQFFSDSQNQKEHGFKLQGSIVKPTKKRYSFSCKLQLLLADPHKRLDITYFVIGLFLFAVVFRWYSKKRRINNMYEFLRQRVLAAPDQILNVTHTMGDLQAQFGAIEESTWQKINEVRTSCKQIGFYEDDFLYWKKM